METLPATLYFVLLELAAGGLLVLLLVELRDEVSRSFALLTGLALWGSAALALSLRASFPPSASWLYPPDPAWLSIERSLLVALLALSGLYLGAVAFGAGAVRRWLGRLAALAALGALLAAALVQPGPQLFGLGAPLSVLVGAIALGAATDGLILGHWYLVTPRLPSRPLLRVTRVLLLALAGQVLLLPILLAFAGRSPDAALGELSLFFWLRLLFGVLFPLGVGVLVWKTASVRSMQSATGLLYVVASLVCGGEIASRSIFFFTGLVV
ncbi:MAG: hypothetical protein HY690_00105 [Chloroflexi bacterium]|nr:hypothetical protein [Chloroflexota bacterium]